MLSSDSRAVFFLYRYELIQEGGVAMKPKTFLSSMLFCTLICFMVSFSPKVSADLSSGLVAYYPFNGNANDESGNGHNGTLYGSTLTADRMGNPNSAFYFNGTASDYIYVGPISISLPVTVTLWLNSTTRNDQWNTLLGWNNTNIPGFNGIAIQTNGDGTIRARVGSYFSDDMISNSIIDGDGKWHCIVINRNLNNERKLYIDGILDVSSTDTASIGGSTNNLLIARSFRPDNESFNEHFMGIIDDVRIYSRVLSDAEIQEVAYLDQDNDGLPDNSDNCPETANGPNLGTCIDCLNGNVGQTCTSSDECGDHGFCSLNQEAICDDDFDGDQITNEEDSCICIDNPDQADADEDGRGDACDNCLNDPNADQEDADGDKIGDVCDNCPDTSNPTQEDTDEDGAGDACDRNSKCPVIKIYGNLSCETELLRNFRDNVLSNTREGQELIKLYYQWGPVIVRAIEEDKKFEKKVKEIIDSVLPMIEKVIE